MWLGFKRVWSWKVVLVESSPRGFLRKLSSYGIQSWEGSVFDALVCFSFVECSSFHPSFDSKLLCLQIYRLGHCVNIFPSFSASLLSLLSFHPFSSSFLFILSLSASFIPLPFFCCSFLGKRNSSREREDESLKKRERERQRERERTTNSNTGCCNT